MAADHAENKAACLALSVATQTGARILAAQGHLARPIEVDVEQGWFDMEIVDTLEAKRGMAGILNAIYHISKSFPGAYLVSDNRKETLDFPAIPLPDELTTTESFADEFLENRTLGVLTDGEGRPLASAA